MDFHRHGENHVSYQAVAAPGGHLSGKVLKLRVLSRVSTPAPGPCLLLDTAFPLTLSTKSRDRYLEENVILKWWDFGSGYQEQIRRVGDTGKYQMT